MKVTIKIEDSKVMEDYQEKLMEAVNFYFNKPYHCDLPVRRGSSIFSYLGREFDAKDYWRTMNGN